MQFIPREKLSKKARRALDRTKRQSWAIRPVTRQTADKTKYNRKKSGYRYDDYGSRISVSEKASIPQ